MKFSSVEDVSLFLIECDRADLINAALTVDFVPTEEMVETFIKARKGTISHLKDFRRKQNAKHQWRTNRYDMMKGIKSFHKSTKGKKFHRSLGRFIASRMNLSGGTMLGIKNAQEESYLFELSEVFKALSSYKTHAWIQADNYMSLSDTADYELFLEEMMASVSHIEYQLMEKSPSIPAAAVDFVLATLNMNYIYDDMAKDEDFQKVQTAFEKILAENAEAEYPYLSTLSKLQELSPLK